jgi:hypothetical protein
MIQPAINSGSVSIPYSYSNGMIQSLAVSKNSIDKYSLEKVTEVILERANKKGEDVTLTVDESIDLFKEDSLFHTTW